MNRHMKAFPTCGKVDQARPPVHWIRPGLNVTTLLDVAKEIIYGLFGNLLLTVLEREYEIFLDIRTYTAHKGAAARDDCGSIFPLWHGDTPAGDSLKKTRWAEGRLDLCQGSCSSGRGLALLCGIACVRIRCPQSLVGEL